MASPVFYNSRARENLRREIAWVIDNACRDPRIPSLTTVTTIKLSDDTRNATVYVSVYGDADTKQGAVAALNHAAPFIQKTVAHRVSLKHFPRLCFRIDDTLDESERIHELLDRIKDDLE